MASTKTVKELYDDCSSTELYRRAYCFGVMAGASQIMELLGDEPEVRRIVPREIMCLEQPLTAEVKAQAFQIWALRNPKLWDSPGSIGVIMALSATWPCP